MSTLQLMRGLPPQGSGSGGGSPITRIPNVVVVLQDGSGDYATLNAALAAVGANGLKIILGTGTFSITGNIPNPGQSQIVIEGQGPGNTIIQFNNTSANSSLDFEGTADATSATLNSDAAAGTNTINIPAASAALLSVGQYVLIRSNKIADPDFTGRKVGEIQKILSISGSTVTFEDIFADTYATANGASSRGLQMLHDITIRNLTIKSNAGSSALGQGEIFFRFVRNVTIENVECDSLWWAGMDFSSCINVRCKVYVHDTQDPAGVGGSTHYGVVCHSATKDSTFKDSFFYKVRHGFTSGGQSGTNFEGVPRNVVVDHCVAQACDEAAFDCHNSGEGIIFVGCVSLGGLPAGTNTQAGTFQIRAPKSAVKSCLAINNAGRAIYFLGSASGGTCTGNTIINTRAVSGGAAGDGVYIDPSVTQINIDGNTMNGCAAHAVNGAGSNHDCIVTNNTCLGCTPTDGDIIFTDSLNVNCSFNQCRDGTGRGLVMIGTSDKWRILGNDWSNKPTTSPTLVGTNNIVFFNQQTAGQALTVTASPLTLSGFGSLTIQTNNATTKTEIDIVPNISTIASVRTGGQLKLYNSSDLTNFEFIQFLTQGTGSYLIDVEKGGTGSLRQLDFQMQGTVAMSMLTGGTMNITSPLAVGTNLSLSATGLTGVRTFTFPDVTDTIVTLTATQTLTNKTLTSPTIATILNTGTLTLPSSTDTLVGRATTDTLSNKTLTSPSMSGVTITSSPITLGGLGTMAIQTNLASTKTQINIVPNIATIASLRTGGQLILYNSSDTSTNYEFIQFLTQGTGNHLIDIEKAGTGSLRQLDIAMSGTAVISVLTGATANIVSPLAIGTNLSLSATGLTAVRTFTFPDQSDTVATLAAANVFTIKQKIQYSTFPQLTLYHTGANAFSGLDFHSGDSALAEVEAARIASQHSVATAGAVMGSLQIQLTKSGTVGQKIIALDANAWGLQLLEPTSTFSYNIVPAAIAANRTLNLPLLTANDTFAVLGLAQTLTNKTLDSTTTLSTNTTGAGSAALGGNSPAITNTAPYTWIQVKSNDGSTVYIPCWK